MIVFGAPSLTSFARIITSAILRGYEQLSGGRIVAKVGSIQLAPGLVAPWNGFAGFTMETLELAICVRVAVGISVTVSFAFIALTPICTILPCLCPFNLQLV